MDTTISIHGTGEPLLRSDNVFFRRRADESFVTMTLELGSEARVVIFLDPKEATEVARQLAGCLTEEFGLDEARDFVVKHRGVDQYLVGMAPDGHSGSFSASADDAKRMTEAEAREVASRISVAVDVVRW